MPSRYLKEGLLTSDAFDRLSPKEESTWMRLLLAVDDFGRFDGRPVVVRSRCFPLKEDMPLAEVEERLSGLARHGLIDRYMVDGKPYVQITRWKDTPRAKVSKYPDPLPFSAVSEQPQAVREQLHANADGPRAVAGIPSADPPAFVFDHGPVIDHVPSPVAVAPVPPRVQLALTGEPATVPAKKPRPRNLGMDLVMDAYGRLTGSDVSNRKWSVAEAKQFNDSAKRWPPERMVELLTNLWADQFNQKRPLHALLTPSILEIGERTIGPRPGAEPERPRPPVGPPEALPDVTPESAEAAKSAIAQLSWRLAGRDRAEPEDMTPEARKAMLAKQRRALEGAA